MEKQTTVKNAFTLKGPGLHTGKTTAATVSPAPAGTGIVFRRTDLDGNPTIPALSDYVVGTDHGTSIGIGSATVFTIEHLMSALHGMGVDNSYIDVDGPEVPILDGSARMWVDGIASSGVEPLDCERRYLVLDRPVQWTDHDKNIVLTASPSDRFSVDCHIEFSSQLIGSQSASVDTLAHYSSEISPCRTFVFLHEVEMLLAHNLIKGGDLDNALVFVDKPLGDDEKLRLAKLFNRDAGSISVHNGVLNTVEPFFPNEPARHKLLDFIGDIYLAGAPIKAHFDIRCPGHHANTQLAKALRS